MVFSIISVTTDAILAAARNHPEKIGSHVGLGGLPVFRVFSVLFSNWFFLFSFYKNRKTVIT